MLEELIIEEDPMPQTPKMAGNEVFLEANFDALSISYSERETIRNHVPEGIDIDTSAAGVPTLAVNGLAVYEPQNPIAGAKRQVDAIEADDDTNLVVIMGLGLGYHAEYLERRFTCPIIVYEPSLDILKTTLGQRPLPLKRTIVVSDIPHLLVETQSRLQFNDRKIIVAAILEYQHLFNDAFETFKKTMNQSVSNAQILENTTAIRSQNWVYHAAQNTPKSAERQPITVLEDKFEKVPGVLVSAGPSLDKNIDALREIQDECVIIAVNAAAKPLQKAGIRPDIIGVVEGLDLRAQLEEIPWLPEVAIAPTLNCFPGFFDLPCKHLFPVADYSVTCSDWFSKAYNWQQMPSGGSVACTAFSLLFTLGCDPIILVGQDLAYTGGRSYASAATFGKQSMQFDPATNKLKAVEQERNHTIEEIRTKGGLSILDNLDAIETEAWGGDGVVYSIGIFNLFRSWFETASNSWAKERTLINATEGGARINGFEEMPLAEAGRRYCTGPIDTPGIIDEAVAGAPPNDLRELIRVIDEDLTIIRRIISRSKEAEATARQAADILENGDIGAADPILRRLSNLETEVRALTRENRIVDTFISGEVNKLRSTRWEDKDENRIKQSQKALRRTAQLFDIIDKGATELLELFTPIIKSLSEKLG